MTKNKSKNISLDVILLKRVKGYVEIAKRKPHPTDLRYRSFPFPRELDRGKQKATLSNG